MIALILALTVLAALIVGATVYGVTCIQTTRKLKELMPCANQS